jgi:hypothetical protein
LPKISGLNVFFLKEFLITFWFEAKNPPPPPITVLSILIFAKLIDSPCDTTQVSLSKSTVLLVFDLCATTINAHQILKSICQHISEPRVINSLQNSKPPELGPLKTANEPTVNTDRFTYQQPPLLETDLMLSVISSSLNY